MKDLNEIRNELLEQRTKFVDRYIAGVAVILTLLGIVAALASYLNFQSFSEIEAEAREYVDRIGAQYDKVEALRDKVEALHDDVKALHGEFKSDIERITAEDVENNPDKVHKAKESVQRNPAASQIDQTIAAAIQFQQQGLFEESIEKWHAIAIVSEGIDKDLEARAWRSVGYLTRKYKNDSGAAINAYDKAIQLDPLYAKAYNNRGVAKAKLGRHEEAITDYDKAIRLDPSASAYYNRGIAKAKLGRHEEAITDYDKAIRLDPGHAKAYNSRGNAKVKLGRHEEAITDYDKAVRLDPSARAYYNRGKTNISLRRMDEARRDFEATITLARDAGDEALASKAERKLKELPNEPASPVATP